MPFSAAGPFRSKGSWLRGCALSDGLVLCGKRSSNPAAGGDIVELRLLWVVSRIALSSEEPSPGDTGTISCLRYGLFPCGERASE